MRPSLRFSRTTSLVLAASVLLVVFAASQLTLSSDSGESQTATICDSGTATEISEVFITNSVFSVSCAKVKAGTQIYFTNHDDQRHSVVTDSPTLDTFDATLEQRDSTYAHAFTAPGAYSISCREHSERLVLIVE